MIRFKLKELLSKREFEEGRRITLGDVAEATRIHRVTLSKIANERAYNAGVDNVNRLCAYFGCQPNDLMEFIPNVADLPEKLENELRGATHLTTVPEPSQNRPKTVPRSAKKTPKSD